MGFFSTNTGLEAQMSDVALAHGLVKEIAGDCWNGKGDMIERVYREVSKRFPKWTRRRVRGIWHREVAGVRFHEMTELAATAAAVAAERDRIEAGRAAHAKFVAETAALAARLERQDEDFHRGDIDVLREMARGSRALGSAPGGGIIAGHRSGISGAGR